MGGSIMKIDNHYVPRLILRRYNEKINTYNLKTKELNIGADLRESFSKKLLYSQEIEDLFNSKIEVEFAKVLDRKILVDSEEISLTRKELAKTKKFLLLAMLRTINGEEFMSLRKEKIAKHLEESIKFNEKIIDGESDFDYWMRTIRCILESEDLASIRNHPLATTKAVQWANNFNSAYLSIWDSEETGEDFIVIDNGMTSEHESTRFINPINDDAIKRGYLLDQCIFSTSISDEQKKSNLRYLYSILFANDFMTENFYIFSITKNRILVLLNPFFRLYDKSDYEVTNVLPAPDIWPTRIKEKDLFLKNKNEYINGLAETLKGKKDDRDLYIYPVRRMCLDDVMYINTLSLDRIDEIIGFSDTSRIKRSLALYSIVNGLNDYTDLTKQLSDLGYSIKVNEGTRTMKEHISTEHVQFSEKEAHYINNFLKAREMSKGSLSD